MLKKTANALPGIASIILLMLFTVAPVAANTLSRLTTIQNLYELKKVAILNGDVFFSGKESVSSPVQLFKVTNNGTQAAKWDMLAGELDSVAGLFVYQGHLYFGARKGTYLDGNYKIWRTNGTIGHVEAVATEVPLSGGDSTIRGHYILNNLLIMQTEQGMFVLNGADGVYPIFNLIVPDSYYDGLVLGNELFFRRGSVTEARIWKTDGTVEGTKKLPDSADGPLIDWVSNLTKTNSHIIYISGRRGGVTAVHWDLWATDGTSPANYVEEMAYGTNIGPNKVADGDNRVFIDYSLANWLYASNGTKEGSYQLPSTGIIRWMKSIGDELYIGQNVGYPNINLLRIGVDDVQETLYENVRLLSSPIVFNGELYFNSYGGVGDTGLVYKLDASDTLDLLLPPEVTKSRALQKAGNSLYFEAVDPTNGRQIWRYGRPAEATLTLAVETDGDGTVLVVPPSGESCSDFCSYTYPVGTSVQLSARLDGNDEKFSGWDIGGERYYNNPLYLEVNSSMDIAAVFEKTCNPPGYVYVDSSNAGGLYEGSAYMTSIGDTTTVDIFLEGHDYFADWSKKGFLNTLYWTSIDERYNPDVVKKFSSNEKDFIGGENAKKRLIPPGQHASFTASFCGPGRIKFVLNVFDHKAFFYTAASSILDTILTGMGIPFTLEDVSSFVHDIANPHDFPSINNAYIHYRNYFYAMSELNIKEAAREVRKMKKSFISFLKDKNQKNRMLQIFGEYEIEIGLRMVVGAVVELALRAVRHGVDFIVYSSQTHINFKDIHITVIAQ